MERLERAVPLPGSASYLSPSAEAGRLCIRKSLDTQIAMVFHRCCLPSPPLPQTVRKCFLGYKSLFYFNYNFIFYFSSFYSILFWFDCRIRAGLKIIRKRMAMRQSPGVRSVLSCCELNHPSPGQSKRAAGLGNEPAPSQLCYASNPPQDWDQGFSLTLPVKAQEDRTCN